MKMEARYIAYDGATFVYKEDAEYHEIDRRLCARRYCLARIVGTYMSQVSHTRSRINSIEKILVNLNEKLRAPGVYETTDHIRLLADRLNYRADLRMEVLNLKNTKSELVKYNKLLSKTDNDIKRYKMAHDELVAGRQNKTK